MNQKTLRINMSISAIQMIRRLVLIASLALWASLSSAQNYTPKQSVWVAKNFQFHTGEVISDLKIGYITIGDPSGIPVLILHGTAGTAKGLLSKNFGDQLFGPGQVLDSSKYFVIIPDAIGVGSSSKPSDGLKMKFPRYNYDDMVDAQYRLVSEGLGVKHLRLVLGNSMGGMQTWLWGVKYPDYMDLLVPMAASPVAMSGRNWMMRRFIIDSVRNDPEWNGGNYTKQPKSIQFATVYFNVGMSGGNEGLYKLAPTREKADQLLNARLSAPFVVDANDNLYQWESSGDYDPSTRLDNIKARVLAINSADDERNPPELGFMEKVLPRIKNSKLFLIPASSETIGHSTTGQAQWWVKELNSTLQSMQ
jgi:homoserine O-acetyltransferase